MIRLTFFVLTLFLALISLLPQGRAQDTLPESMVYDPTFTGRPSTSDHIRAMQRKSMEEKGFIRPDKVKVAIVKHDYMDDDQFGIQMSVPDLISGCYDLTPLEYEAEFIDPYYLDIKVKQYRRTPPEGNAALRKCDPQNKMSSALMVLSKTDLMKRGTQEIRFSTDMATDHYRIVLDDARLELVPRSMLVFQATGLSGPLKDRMVYSFPSDKMIALHVPMARPGEDVSSALTALASTRALTPVPTGGDQTTGPDGAVYYFYDDKGDVRSLIANSSYTELGKITVNRPYDGPQGRTAIPVELSVFVTLPGTRL